jgi:hypothetical protein
LIVRHHMLCWLTTCLVYLLFADNLRSRKRKRHLTERHGIIVDEGILSNEILVLDRLARFVVIEGNMQFVLDAFLKSYFLSDLMSWLLVVVDIELLQRALLILLLVKYSFFHLINNY